MAQRFEQPAETSLWAHPRTGPAPGTGAQPGPSDAGERFPLSGQQEFLSMVDSGDDAGPFGSRYTIVGGWRITGPLDVDTLRVALFDVVRRHEALRTRVLRDGGGATQMVLAPVAPPLLVRELPDTAPVERERLAQALLNEVETIPLGMDQNPALRAVLGRFDADDAVLVLAAHHTAVDGWSIQILMRDLAAGYAARRRGGPPDLAPARQYREYVRWQRDADAGPAMAAARGYWQQRLRGGRVLPIRMVRPRASQRPGATSWYRFLADDRLRRAVQDFASSVRSTPFMVLMAAYLRYRSDATGETDIVVPTFSPGRRPAWTQDVVGSFFNLLPLRVDLAACRTFSDLVSRVRAECLAAYAHEIPFVHIIQTAPELMKAAAGEHHASCVFQFVQSPFMKRGELVGELRYEAMRRRLVSQPIGSQIPDGALWAMEFDPAGGIVGSVAYGRVQFDEAGISGMVAEYLEVLRRSLSRPGL